MFVMTDLVKKCAYVVKAMPEATSQSAEKEREHSWSGHPSNRPSIFPITASLALRVTGVAGSYPSCLRGKCGGATSRSSRRLIAEPHRGGQAFTLTLSAHNLELPVCAPLWISPHKKSNPRHSRSEEPQQDQLKQSSSLWRAAFYFPFWVHYQHCLSQTP